MHALRFKSKSRQLRRKMWWQNMRFMVILVTIILLILAVVIGTLSLPLSLSLPSLPPLTPPYLSLSFSLCSSCNLPLCQGELACHV